MNALQILKNYGDVSIAREAIKELCDVIEDQKEEIARLRDFIRILIGG